MDNHCAFYAVHQDIQGHLLICYPTELFSPIEFRSNLSNFFYLTI